MSTDKTETPRFGGIEADLIVWNDIPDYLGYVAQDPGGGVYGFAEEPARWTTPGQWFGKGVEYIHHLHGKLDPEKVYPRPSPEKIDRGARVEEPEVTEAASDRQVGGTHYKDFEIQPGYFTTKNGLSFYEGCVIKRVCRHSRGGKGAEDIRKAIHELELILEYQYDQ